MHAAEGSVQPSDGEHAAKRCRTDAISTLLRGLAPRAIVGTDEAPPEADVAAFRAIVDSAAASGVAWKDEEFPAAQPSISGKADAPTESTTAAPAPAPKPTPKPAPVPAPAPASAAERLRCGCGVAVASAVVSRDTPNNGRAYYHCAQRKCGFFAWADGGGGGGGGGRGARTKPLQWARMPTQIPVVTDFGFRAADLRQGGVGDCWFMSALAVVAERHDLVAKLFAMGTARNSGGAYCVRLFLDGEWTSVMIDDLLPVTATPRRAALAFDTKLAFCRTASAGGAQQLWGSLVEKAYAKAHGSYYAISGGQVAEALLDLTGAPTEMIYLGHADDLELMWARLRSYAALGLPMGCGTNGAVGHEELQQVGLCGGHAYSILDVREALTSDGTVRLLRIRNPHGVGEWNGDWSDASAKWSQLLCGNGGGRGESRAESSVGSASGGGIGGAGGFERTGVDDGTFWLEYTHFLMGFSHVDVCFAFRDWHAASLANYFPFDRKTSKRCCAAIHFVTVQEPAMILAMALQPTRRGAWCRTDRKKSYRLGDVSLLICRIQGGRAVEYVGGGFRGSDRGERCWCVRLDRPGEVYAIIPLCLGSNPSAAESVKRAPFSVRLWSSSPISVSTGAAFPPHQAASASSISAMEALALQAVHLALLYDGRGGATRPPPKGLRASELERMMQASHNVPMLLSNGGAGRVARRVFQISRSIPVLVLQGSKLTLIAVYNLASGKDHESQGAVFRVQVTAYAKSNVARGADGVIASDKSLADAYYAKTQQRAGRASDEAGFRWPAKWSAFRCSASVSARRCRLVLVLAASGVQAELGEIECIEEPLDSTSKAAGAAADSRQRRGAKATDVNSTSSAMMRSWLEKGTVQKENAQAMPVGQTSTRADAKLGLETAFREPLAAWAAASSNRGVFAEVQFRDDDERRLGVLCDGRRETSVFAVGVSAASSVSSNAEDADAELQAALSLSLRESRGTTWPATASGKRRVQDELEEALALSALEQTRRSQYAAEEADLAAAIAASLHGSGQAVVGKAEGSSASGSWSGSAPAENDQDDEAAFARAIALSLQGPRTETLGTASQPINLE